MASSFGASFIDRLRGDARCTTAPRLWAIVGAGASVVTANLAVALGARYRRCTLVDASTRTGALQRLLGSDPASPTGSAAAHSGSERFEDSLGATRFPRVSLVTRPLALTSGRAIERGLAGLERLAMDEVLVDLGSGSAAAALDFCLAATRTLVVVSPEPASIEDTYAFLKAAQRRAQQRQAPVASLRTALAAPFGTSPRERRADESSGFRPGLIVNGVRAGDDTRLGRQIVATSHRCLGLQLEWLGNLPWDPAVRVAARQSAPVVEIDAGCGFWLALDALAARIARPAPAPPAAAADDEPLVAAGATPGTYLRSWRQRTGLSLQQAMTRSRIPLAETIENERYAELPPEESYLRGLVQEYARALGAPRPEALAIKYLERYRWAQQRTAPPPARAAG